MPDIYIRPKEIPSSTTTMSPALIALAVQLGEFKAISGIEFGVEMHDRLHLKLTYYLDEAFIALRLKFGHLFVEKPQVAQARPARPVPPPPPLTRPKVRPLTTGGGHEMWTWQDRFSGKTALERMAESEREEASRQLREIMNTQLAEETSTGWKHKLTKRLLGR